MSHFRSYTEIDLKAIRDNALAIKGFVRSALIAVVKADGYGHGAVRVAETLEPSVSMFAVATFAEAIALRQAGIKKEILILFSCLPEEAAGIVEFNLTATVSDWEFAKELNECGGARVHVNVNTGMNRSGVPSSEALGFLERLRTLQSIAVAGVFTHLATADAVDKRFVRVQLERFSSVLAAVEGPLIHAANSAATLAVPESHYDAVRPGLSLYGIYPAAERPIGLEPALAWKTRVGWVGSLSEGEGVSYGLTYTAAQPVRVAMIQVGYADGYPRALSNIGQVLIGGVRRKIIGQVCMDVSVVELGSTDAVAVGDEVVLVGKQRDAEITVDDVAKWAGTIPYEILTGISPRVVRKFQEVSV